MAKAVPPPFGVGMVEESGFLSRAWLQWFQDIQNNTAEGVVQLGSGTISSSETITLTTGITSEYDHYRIELLDIIVSQPNDILNVRVSEDAGSTYKSGATDYSWLIEENTGTQATTTDNTATELPMNSSGFANSGQGIIRGNIEFFTPANTVNAKHFRWDLSYKNNSGNLTKTSGTGLYNGTGAIDAIKLYLNTGVLTSGSYKLYGIK
jgi:hypothetical protein